MHEPAYMVHVDHVFTVTLDAYIPEPRIHGSMRMRSYNLFSEQIHHSANIIRDMVKALNEEHR